MARAKRTERTDARRRYRAATLGSTATDVEAGDGAQRSDGSTRDAEPPARPRSGIRYAFGAAFRPLDLRGDLAALPALIRTRAMLIPLAILVIAATAWGASESGLPPVGAETGPDTSASALVLVAFFGFQYFVMPPPIGAAFLGGFLAPRGSWLIGWIIGLVAAIAVAILAAIAPSSIDRIVGTTDETRMAYVTQGLLVSSVACSMFAAAAAWYKRFLELANPNRRGRAAPAKARQAGRSNQRPLLSRTSARRR